MNEQKPEKKAIETEDVEAHRLHLNDETDKAGLLEDDTEAHRFAMLEGADTDDDDVEGHRAFSVQPPRDADNSGNQF